MLNGETYVTAADLAADIRRTNLPRNAILEPHMTNLANVLDEYTANQTEAVKRALVSAYNELVCRLSPVDPLNINDYLRRNNLPRGGPRTRRSKKARHSRKSRRSA